MAKKMIITIIILTIFIVLLVSAIKGGTENITGSFTPIPSMDPIQVYTHYPVNQTENKPRPVENFSVYVNGTGFDLYVSYLNMTGTTNQTQLMGVWLGQTEGYFSIHPLVNATLTTQFIWGNTTYYWNINITNGTAWWNYTYYYTTTGSRYDVDNSSDVTVSDLTVDWSHRAGTFDRYYDVDWSGDITVSDLTKIWSNR